MGGTNKCQLSRTKDSSDSSMIQVRVYGIEEERHGAWACKSAVSGETSVVGRALRPVEVILGSFAEMKCGFINVFKRCFRNCGEVRGRSAAVARAMRLSI